MGNPVEYQLPIREGCFAWSCNRHDLVFVKPEFNSSSNCSMTARLRSIAPYGGRKETVVYANDLRGTKVIAWRVFIDNIAKIKIGLKPTKLLLDEIATLQVHAFDRQGNIFSSLVGVQFMWQLKSESEGQSNRLVNIRLKDSPLKDCGGYCDDFNSRVKLEDGSKFSDLYIVKAIEVGSEDVVVDLEEASVGHLTSHIPLTIAEAMSLYPPSPIYVLIGADVQYILSVVRHGASQVQSLPSPHHEWSSINSSVAQVDTENGRVRALKVGVTTIVVKDIRPAGNMQLSLFHVILPDKLFLFMSPLSLSGDLVDGLEPIPCSSTCYVMVDRSYLIHVKVFTAGPERQEIFVTESDKMQFQSNHEELWKLHSSLKGATNDRILEAKSFGLGNLTAILSYKTGHDTRKYKVLQADREVMVCDQVEFAMGGFDRILLPWAPDVNQTLQLKARGCCSMSSGEYKWFSSDEDVVYVSDSGLVHVRNPGKATIRVWCSFDSLNFDELVVQVSIPYSMLMLPNFATEALVGSRLQASVALRTSKGEYFYACDAFRDSMKWKTDNESFVLVNATHKQEVPHPTLYGPPCAWIDIYASSSGRTVVHAENQFPDHHNGTKSVTLKVSSSIASYSPVVVRQASDGNQFGGYWFDLAHIESQNQPSNLDYLYLAPGTHSDVMFRGGPERWGKNVEFVEEVQVLSEQKGNAKDKTIISQMSTNYGNAYRIKCETLGSFRLVFRRGNLEGDDHPVSVVSEAHLLLMCAFPASIVIIVDQAVNALQIIRSAAQSERTRGGIRATPITVSSGRRIRLSAVGLSHSGKAFANSSSISLRWKLSMCEGLARLEDDYGSTEYSSWERFLILQNTSGLCVVGATAASYIDSLSRSDFATIFEASKITPTDAIQLQLINASTEYSLFSSSEAKTNILVTESDDFSVRLLSLGTELKSPIKYDEALGNPVREGDSINICEVETNRPDVLLIEQYDGRIHIRAKGQGLAVIRVSFFDNPQKSVYATIVVDSRKAFTLPVSLKQILAWGSGTSVVGLSIGYYFLKWLWRYLKRHGEGYVVSCIQGLTRRGIEGLLDAFCGTCEMRSEIERCIRTYYGRPDRGFNNQESFDTGYSGFADRGFNYQQSRSPRSQGSFDHAFSGFAGDTRGTSEVLGRRGSVILREISTTRPAGDVQNADSQELPNPHGRELIVRDARGYFGASIEGIRNLVRSVLGRIRELPVALQRIGPSMDGIRNLARNVPGVNRELNAPDRRYVLNADWMREWRYLNVPWFNRELPVPGQRNGPAPDVRNEEEGV